MKKVLNLIALFFVFQMNAQLEVREKVNYTQIGEVKNGLSLVAKLEYAEKEGSDNVYILVINNIKYTHITDLKSATFYGKQTLDDLYQIFKSAFTEENKKNKKFGVNFKLGDTECSIGNTRNLGITSLVLYIESGYCYLTERQVDKLFGYNN